MLDGLPAYKVRPADDRFETGTGNFEGLAGTRAAVEYLAWLGRSFGGAADGADRGAAVHAGMRAIRAYEMELYGRLAAGIAAIPGARIHGITDQDRYAERTPTAAVTFPGISPRDLAAALGRDGIATWDGDFYATGLVERLGLAGSGGLLRIGLTHYNSADEVDRLVEALERIAGGVATPA